MNKDNNPANADDDEFEDFDFDDDEEETALPAAPATSPPASTPPTAASTPTPQSPPPPAAARPSTPPPAAMKEQEEALISPSEIPVILTIEIGRLQMTADYLFNLQQGNTLPLHAPLESGVWLCINGKRVGRGELVRV